MTAPANYLSNNKILNNRLSPILKWAGGKEQELKYIHPAMPKQFTNYYGHPSPTPKSNRHFKPQENRQYSPL